MLTSFIEARQTINRLGYRYMGQVDGRMGWVKREERNLVITISYEVGEPRLREIGRFRLTVQNEDMTQMVAIDKRTNENIARYLTELECALLNGIESLQRDL